MLTEVTNFYSAVSWGGGGRGEMASFVFERIL